MTDVLFSDVSEFQGYANDSYPHPFISFRSNDGTYRDSKFAHNLAWAKSAVARGKLLGFIVYFVYEPNWQETVATFKAMVGAPDSKMAVMIDVESWGRIRGNNSPQINASRENIIAWLGGNRKRVIGYGNVGDLNSLWPQKGDCKLIVAAYGSNPGYPNKLAHQFADNWNTPPFGPCDINSADGYTPQAFAAALGLVAPTPAPKPPAPKPVPTPTPVPNPIPPFIPTSVLPEDNMFIKFINSGPKNNPNAVYLVSGGQLVWIDALTYGWLGKPGPIHSLDLRSVFWNLPVVPGTQDYRGKTPAAGLTAGPEEHDGPDPAGSTLADELVPAENQQTT